MIPLLIGIGILLVILGIAAFFVPGVSKIINVPGSERAKAFVVLIIGMILIIYEYFSG